MQSPRKIHVITKAYLQGWTLDGLLLPVSVAHGPQKLKSPAGVGWDLEWWGAGDKVLNRVCEESCQKLETVLPQALAAVQSSWPLELGDRAVLAQFLALHVLRSRAFPGWLEPIRARSLAELRERFPSDRHYKDFARVMSGDRECGKKLISLINKLGTVFGSMHWTFLRFDEPLLVTGDQPVSPVPLLGPGEVQEVAAILSAGWLDTCEIRCPLTPQLALVMTWWAGPEAGPVDGAWAHAVNLNTATTVQAVKQSFRFPGRLPALALEVFAVPQPQVLSAVATGLLPGYTNDTARSSARRELAIKKVRELIEQRDHETLTILTSAAA